MLPGPTGQTWETCKKTPNDRIGVWSHPQHGNLKCHSSSLRHKSMHTLAYTFKKSWGNGVFLLCRLSAGTSIGAPHMHVTCHHSSPTSNALDGSSSTPIHCGPWRNRCLSWTIATIWTNEVWNDYSQQELKNHQRKWISILFHILIVTKHT